MARCKRFGDPIMTTFEIIKKSGKWCSLGFYRDDSAEGAVAQYLQQHPRTDKEADPVMAVRASAVYLIKDYVHWQINDAAAGEPPIALHAAVLEAQSGAEVEALGRAILERQNASADADHRFGCELYDERLAEIAERLGWTP
jgi:hypothetical protein